MGLVKKLREKTVTRPWKRLCVIIIVVLFVVGEEHPRTGCTAAEAPGAMDKITAYTALDFA